LIIASSFDIIILQNKVLQIDGMIIMAPMDMMIMMVKMEMMIMMTKMEMMIMMVKMEMMIIMAPMEMMIMMAKMEMMIMMAKMALYFFFLFMEASSCSDLESCLAIVETSSSFFFNLASNCALAASPASKAAFCC